MHKALTLFMKKLIIKYIPGQNSNLNNDVTSIMLSEKMINPKYIGD